MRSKEYITKRIPGENKFVDWDYDTQSFAIFGSESGFCYQWGFGSEREAEKAMGEVR